MQGFAWRPGSVSFKTLEEDGDLRVYVRVRDILDVIRKDTIIAIRVPFFAKSDLIEIASITDGFNIQVYSKKLFLYFENGEDENGMWCLLTFVKKYDPQPEILLCDDNLRPGKILIMEVDPAM